MGIFSSQKSTVAPNFSMIPTKYGPVIDAFSFNRLPKDEHINAESKALMDSGFAYWNMKVDRYGCELYNNIARGNASLFFGELWHREYYNEIPAVGFYVAMYKVFNQCGWCELSEKAMRVYLDDAYPRLDLQRFWAYIAFYTAFCSGSYANAIQWIRQRIDLDRKPGFLGKIAGGYSAMLPLLRHYLVLQQIQKEVPFDAPEIDGNLGDYWKKIYNEYHNEEALLEYAFIKTLLGHNPFVAYEDDYPNGAAVPLCVRPAIPFDILNHFSKMGNLPALTVTSDLSWRFLSEKSSLPEPNDILRVLDKEVSAFGEDWFKNEFLSARAKVSSVLPRKEAFASATEDYLAGIFEYALKNDEKARELMLSAAKQREILSGAYFYGDEINPAESAFNWLRRKAAEKNGIEESSAVSDMESLSDGLNKSHSEIRLRKLGFLFRDGFKNLPPKKDYWEALRDKAYYAGKYGLVLYCLDDGEENAESTFRSMIDNPGEWKPHTITCAWLGLAYIRFLRKDYGTKELLMFMERDFAERNLFTEERIKVFADKIRFEDISAFEELSDLFLNNRDIHIGNLIMKDMGKMFFYSAEKVFQNYVEMYENGEFYEIDDKLFGMGKDISDIVIKWVKFEMKHSKKQLLLGRALFFGLKYNIPYVCNFFADDEIMESVGNIFGVEERINALYTAQSGGYDVAEKLRLLRLEKRRIDYEIYEAEHKDDPWWKGAYDPNAPSTYSSDQDVDNFLDILERLGNEGGYTNKELYYAGERSAWDDYYDEMWRDYLKDQYRW
ncbi:MAG: hypothetical protein IKL57_06120 [Oscillospiraceae bacterium]|nr:hypothetical protein [Oscillospiraceae bacterium]MBR3611017.1 hypothetical protein [Oscillospiraceae bacterium]